MTCWSLPSVSQVKLLGTRDREISIELNEEDLQRHNLTISDIVTKNTACFGEHDIR